MRDYCDLEPVDHYTERLVRGRKPHKCCETGRAIAGGEWHWLIKMKFEGRWDTYRQSWAAYRLARALNYDPMAGMQCWIPFCGLFEEADNYNISREEWEAVCAGIVTRGPVGDEAERVAAMGVEMPQVMEVARA